MKKAVCLLLCAVTCLALTCCKGGEGDSSAPENTEKPVYGTEEISLLYNAGDSFNPYTAGTKCNREVSRLMYDPLLKYDNEFNPVYCLASSASLDGQVCTVKLKTAYFTDKTQVTAEDVVYSYNLAKKSDTAYSSALFEVISAEAAGGTVVFNLNRTDPYFLNLLDFPIIKQGSGELRNSDGEEIAPTGCGRYYLSDEPGILLRNDAYHGKIGDVSKINLINAPDDASASHYVEVGAADMYYADETAASIARMSGKRADVNTNNFVYIGINRSYGLLSNELVRYALSAAINRTEICHTAYFDNAVPATGFINPVIKETAAVQSLKTTADAEITVENLEKIGYNKLIGGYYCNDASRHLTFSLLVNSDNPSRVAAAKLIASQIGSAGIEINVTERKYSEYLAALEAGHFQLYLGEIRVLANMDMSNLVAEGGSAAYGTAAPSGDTEEGKAPVSVCADMVKKYNKGECSLSDLAGVFLTEMPQIPVCYRNGMLFYTSRIKSVAAPSQSDIFYLFENYKF